jgi:uncharacterized protein YdeI (YjbR/CyaY-like superfamily)
VKLNLEKKKPKRTIPKKGPVETSDEFNLKLDENPVAKSNWESLAPYKKREYTEWFSSAKRPSTQISRMDKAILLLMDGKGLNDKYRK